MVSYCDGGWDREMEIMEINDKINKMNSNIYCLRVVEEKQHSNTDDRNMKYYRLHGKQSDNIC